ncbi:MAG: GNAT family N-acetyltransferase [Rhodocyclaceae bacterium]|nr:GNAT family N-acetyltransferase [Rhodocyclaceae bacterium]
MPLKSSPQPAPSAELRAGGDCPDRVPDPAGPISPGAPLDNIVWHALTGPQARFAAGEGGARRFARGFSALLGFEDPASPDFGAIEPYCDPGEAFYCLRWRGPAPRGWRIVAEGPICLMVCREPVEWPDAPKATPLSAEHVPQALALAEATRPGPFGPRTMELGDYVGVFEDGRLVAMAGERMRAGAFREISGVCTDPAHRGRGLALQLLSHLLRRQRERGEQSFLHVMRDNPGARRLYESLGYRLHAETQVRVIERE